jgi:hypothetical protein
LVFWCRSSSFSSFLRADDGSVPIVSIRLYSVVTSALYCWSLEVQQHRRDHTPKGSRTGTVVMVVAAADGNWWRRPIRCWPASTAWQEVWDGQVRRAGFHWSSRGCCTSMLPSWSTKFVPS